MASREQELGELGEKYVRQVIEYQGFITQGTHWGDREKDLLVEDNRKVEIKTQRPFHQQKAFSVGENQYKKLSEADYVYFVSVLDYTHRSPTAGNIYRLTGKEWADKNYLYITKAGKRMLLVNIFDCQHVAKLPEDQAEKLAIIANGGPDPLKKKKVKVNG